MHQLLDMAGLFPFRVNGDDGRHLIGDGAGKRVRQRFRILSCLGDGGQPGDDRYIFYILPIINAPRSITVEANSKRFGWRRRWSFCRSHQRRGGGRRICAWVASRGLGGGSRRNQVDGSTLGAEAGVHFYAEPPC